jgi:hypothetical protein
MMAAVLAAVLPRLMPVDGPTPTPPPAPAPVPKPAPKVVPKVAPTDPERDLAEWVLGLGGHGTVLPKTSSRRLFSAEAPLPKNRFAVTAGRRRTWNASAAATSFRRSNSTPRRT